MNKSNILYLSAADNSGYANAARGYIYNHIKNGDTVYFDDIYNSSVSEKSELFKYISKNIHKISKFGNLFFNWKLKDLTIVLHSEPLIWDTLFDTYSKYIDSYKEIIGRTVWDFSRLPENWISAINNSKVTCVSVPSNWCRTVFIKSGVKKKIIVEPHTIPDIQCVEYDRNDFFKSSMLFSPYTLNMLMYEKRVSFLTVASLITRKNLNSIIRNYLNTFKYEDQTILFIKITYKHLSEKNKFIENLKYQIANRLLYDINFKCAPILLISDELSFDQMQSLYKSVDCYINVSMGEGFSLPCYNAFIFNKNIISPKHGGLVDYLENYNNLYDVKYNIVPLLNLNANSNILNYSMSGIRAYNDDICLKLKAVYNKVMEKYVDVQSYSYRNNIPKYSPTQKQNKKTLYTSISQNQSNCSINNITLRGGEVEILINPLSIHSDYCMLEFSFEVYKKVTIKCGIFDDPIILNAGIYNIKFGINISKNNDSFCIDISSDDVNNDEEYGEIINLIGYDLDNNFYIFENNISEYKKELNNNNNNNGNSSRPDVIFIGDYGEKIISINEQCNDEMIEFERKIYFGNQLSFYSHRSGWDYTLNKMSCLNTQSGIYCDGFLENNFAWRRNDSIIQKKIPYNIPWIGFMHNPPNQPPWFSDNNAFCNSIINDPYFVDSLRLCRGLFTLSEYHAKFIRNYINFLPVISLKHPTEIPKKRFSYQAFENNNNKKIITIGWWLRRLNIIYYLNCGDKFKKIRLLPNNKSKETIRRLEVIESDIYGRKPTDNERKSVTQLDFVSNDEYDTLLSENIVYLNLYDSSANNAIIECIARATPILINKHPAVVEYLGENYPLYLKEDTYDIEKIINNNDLIKTTHLYLCNIQNTISIDKFLYDFVNSDIYKKI